MAEDATYFSIMVLDVEGFSKRANPPKGALRADMYEVARAAAADAALPWDEFATNDTGDGALVVIPPTVPAARVAGPMLKALSDRLAERTRGAGAANPLRLRVALHHGLVHRDGHGWFGDAVDFTFRLVEAQPLRDALTAAEGADVVFIVSDEVYGGVIRHGYRLIDPAAYAPVRFDAKQLKGIKAWVNVPSLPYPPGLPPFTPDPPEPGGPGRPGGPTARPSQPAATVPGIPLPHNHNEAQVVHGDQVGVKNITVNGPMTGRL
jgi:class 3 adenylate cyclase